MDRDNPQGARAELIQQIGRGIVAYMTRATVRTYRMAEQVGLGPTDLHCLGLIQLQGPQSAGALANSTGLTTSAMTAVIDRLERSGLAVREPDPADRRRVIVRLDEQQVAERILPMYAEKYALAAQVYARFQDEELAVVRDFLLVMEEVSATAADEEA
jgi:DNA-binding MarR family transcriptional regulator